MTTLQIYTAAKTDAITKTIGAALKGMKPHIPPHKFISYNDSSPAPVPGHGEVVLVCGDKPLSRLREQGIVAKKATINQTREKPIPCNGGFYMTTYDPNIISNMPELNQTIGWDVRLATRLMTTGTVKPVVGQYSWVKDFQREIDYVEKEFKKTGKAVEVTVDTEGMSFYPWYEDRDILSIQFTAIPGTASVLYLGPQKHPVELDPDADLFSQIEWLLTSPKVKIVAANGKFDMIWIAEKWGLECTNFKFDPILAGNLLDENRSNSLNALCKLKTDIGGYDDDFNDKYDKGHMELIPANDEFLTYAGGDTDGLQRAAGVIRDELCEDDALANFYITIMHPAARAFEKIERRGVCVDVEKMHALSSELQQVLKVTTDQALNLLPQKMRIKHRDRIDDQIAKGKSPFLSSILKEYFFSPSGLNLTPIDVTEKTKEPSTAKSHLKKFGDVPEAKAMVDLLTELDVAAKTDSTFVTGYLKHLRPDGRFHPSYMLFHGGMYDDEDDDAGTVCVTADTLFMTSRGHIPFTEVKVGDLVISHGGVSRAVLALVDNGVKPVYQVKLSNGAAINCTGNHPFRVGNTWVRADKLQKRQDVDVLPETEIWQQIEGWPFWVSTWGRVRSAKGTILQQYPKGKWGHLKVCLFRNGAQKRGPDRRDFPVHRLVAEAFVQNPSKLPEVRHLNGIAWDNRFSNLTWGTSVENRDDMRKHGTGQGAHGNQAKVNWEAVSHMRACSLTDKELAAIYGVSRELVRDIRAFKKWVPREPRNCTVQFSTAKVVSVTYIGDLPTYGVTVEEDHSHVTNGIVTHNTGRLSAKDPAIQLIPKKTKWAKRIRECFNAPPGKVLCSADYIQGELKVVACVGNEEAMIHAYLKGLDLHAVTGARLGGMSYDAFMKLENLKEEPWLDAPHDANTKTLAGKFKYLRDRAKPANFGLLYGMSAEGLIAYAWASYNLKLTLEEATVIREMFFTLYPGLIAYHDKQKKLVRHWEMVRSPLGRIRHLPTIRAWDREVKARAERQAINSPIQSTLSDMMLWAIARIEAALPGQIEIVAMIHDAFIAYVEQGKELEVMQKACDIMAELPFKEVGWEPQLRFTAEAEAGLDLAHVKKLPIAA
jgi:DNA polymerase I-like protein with 3'-5' exonuclease and polymerase domains